MSSVFPDTLYLFVASSLPNQEVLTGFDRLRQPSLLGVTDGSRSPGGLPSGRRLRTERLRSNLPLPPLANAPIWPTHRAAYREARRRPRSLLAQSPAGTAEQLDSFA